MPERELQLDDVDPAQFRAIRALGEALMRNPIVAKHVEMVDGKPAVTYTRLKDLPKSLRRRLRREMLRLNRLEGPSADL